MHRADGAEAQVWDMISALLKEPEQLRADLDRMIELERRSMRSDPDREQETWLDKLTEVDRKRARYQEMAADDLITFDELRARLAELDSTRSVAERELQALRSHKELVDELEADRDSLLDSLTGMAPNALDSLAPEERHHVYKMLKLRVTVSLDGTLEVSGAFGDDFTMCKFQRGSGSPSGRSS
jgi:chromosome segregation ATPase